MQNEIFELEEFAKKSKKAAAIKRTYELNRISEKEALKRLLNCLENRINYLEDIISDFSRSFRVDW